MEISESMKIIISNAERIGSLKEKVKITKILGSHVEICNYQAVNDEECDVCAWAKDSIEAISKDDDE